MRQNAGKTRGRQMRAQIKLFAMICILVTPLGAGTQHDQPQDSSCAVIQKALSDYQRIKFRTTRGEVEKYFAQDGGAQFPSNTRYVYPKCSYLHVDVEFEAKGPADRLFSPDDTVTKTSKLYVDYSAKD
jgi:hypothetical protein